MEASAKIPGHEGYTVTPDGKVFRGNYLVRCFQSPGRAARVRLRIAPGKTVRVAIAKLVALAYIPNPFHYTHIVFKDRDKNNCTTRNIQWVSKSEFIRFVNRYEERTQLLGPPRPRREPDWIDPDRIPMIGHPGYYITAMGVVYKGDRIVKPVAKKGKSLKIRIRKAGIDQFMGLATQVAIHFLPNPRRLRYIIFKDRDNHNCRASNIAWVDGETFIYYCGINKGGKKLVLPREEAIRRCTDVYLRNYYKTLDESWLHECWQIIEKRAKFPDWDSCRSECYLYFIDRAQRFSLLRDPVGLLIAYMKAVRVKLKQEISLNMSNAVVRRTDESLRILKSRCNE